MQLQVGKLLYCLPIYLPICLPIDMFFLDAAAGGCCHVFVDLSTYLPIDIFYLDAVADAIIYFSSGSILLCPALFLSCPMLPFAIPSCSIHIYYPPLTVPFIHFCVVYSRFSTKQQQQQKQQL